MNQRVSDLTTDILQTLFKHEETCEATSTEDFLSKVEDINEKINRGEVLPESMVVGSLDVEALYPSIKTMEAGRIARDCIQKSSLKLEGIDYRWALVYLALTMSNAEKI